MVARVFFYLISFHLLFLQTRQCAGTQNSHFTAQFKDCLTRVLSMPASKVTRWKRAIRGETASTVCGRAHLLHAVQVRSIPLFCLFFLLPNTHETSEWGSCGEERKEGNGEGCSREIPREKQLRLGNALLLPESIWCAQKIQSPQ